MATSMPTPLPIPPPIYFETSWAILSTIGLFNVMIGVVVIGITSLSPITIVPVVVSIANAIADGLCYYAFYADYPPRSQVIAAAFADVFWLIQEAGLSFYSYQILTRVLRSRERRVFILGYWLVMLLVVGSRFTILTCRALDLLSNDVSRTELIDHLHSGYFANIALLEIWASVFLLRKFFAAREGSARVGSATGLFRYLTRSTEIRLAVLTIIGVSRAATYSFQTTAQSATNATGQVDRFLTTLECLFPIIMYIDILAAKSLVNSSRGGDTAQYSSRVSRGVRSGTQGMHALSNLETRVDAAGPRRARSSSTEQIVTGATSTGSGGDDASDMAPRAGKGIIVSKTVEFRFDESEVRPI